LLFFVILLIVLFTVLGADDSRADAENWLRLIAANPVSVVGSPPPQFVLGDRRDTRFVRHCLLRWFALVKNFSGTGFAERGFDGVPVAIPILDELVSSTLIADSEQRATGPLWIEPLFVVRFDLTHCVDKPAPDGVRHPRFQSFLAELFGDLFHPLLSDFEGLRG
jgi:hypothetical protein